MVGKVARICDVCGSNAGFNQADDGFFYCGYCNSQADDIFDTGIDQEQFYSLYSASCSRARPSNPIAVEPISQVKLNPSQFFDDMEDTMADDGPRDFGSSVQNFSYEDYYSEIRSRYVTGLQVMIQLQCQALVEKFSVSPLVIGLVGPLWLRFLASTRIMADDWADQVVHDSETQAQGKLPYFAAFSEIEKQLGSQSRACPIRVSRMFRPNHALSSQKLESMAATIANKIGLQLSPVNFHAIASRYCQELSLPTKDILPLACQICEWSMPSELYLSANELRIPTCACVMSILIVSIRILFNINGYGFWESSLSGRSCSPSQVKNDETATESTDRDYTSINLEHSGIKSEKQDSGLSAVELMQLLEAKYNELNDIPAYSCDLSSYLQYCKDVAFSGLCPSYEDLEEEKLLSDFWEFYQNKKPAAPLENPQTSSESSGLNDKRSPDKSAIDTAIKQLMSDMEENKFCYISPRSRVKRKDYLHYARRRKFVYIYAVHADYYILLRSCAKVAQVETRIMHMTVLSLERRLEWLEKRIDSSLHFKPNLEYICNLCENGPAQNTGNDPMGVNS